MLSVDTQRPDFDQGGFSFENCRRNEMLSNSTSNGKALNLPKARKTGTTIVGCKFADGVILGADTRATEGPIVADKNCAKIHYIADNMYCCGAGTAADTEMVTLQISSQMSLLKLNTGRIPRVATACRRLSQKLYGYRGYIGAYLILGGVDSTGAHLYSVHAHGSVDKLPYITMGSGSLAAMSVFESRWRPNMARADAMQLVRDAIAGGIFNDLGSGSNVDLCVLEMHDNKPTADYIRPFDEANVKGQRKADYTPKLGSTRVLRSQVTTFDVITETTTPIAMETA